MIDQEIDRAIAKLMADYENLCKTATGLFPGMWLSHYELRLLLTNAYLRAVRDTQIELEKNRERCDELGLWIVKGHATKGDTELSTNGDS